MAWYGDFGGWPKYVPVGKRIEAVVGGSQVYDIAIAITPLAPEKWRAITRDCAMSIGSLIDLLAGRMADDVMQRLARPDDGMFPSPRQITMKCSCPDGAQLCKHLAAVLYGVGHRLDSQPELLFLLRGVDQQELIAAATQESVSQAVRGDAAHALAGDELGAIFGIDLGSKPRRPTRPATKPKKKLPGKRSPAKPAAKTKRRKKPPKKSPR